MEKTAVKKVKAEGWARSSFTNTDLKKLKKVGLLPKAVEVVILGDKIIPCTKMDFEYFSSLSFIADSFSPPMNSFVGSSLFMACNCIISRQTPFST
jgi:hypothetical protein